MIRIEVTTPSLDTDSSLALSWCLSVRTVLSQVSLTCHP